MKAIKAVVAAMGVLLLLGLGLLGYGLYSKARTVSAPPAPAPAPAAASENSAGTSGVLDFGTVRLDLPPGAALQQMAAAGSRIVLRIAVPGGEERLMVIDPAQGKVTGTFVLAAPAPGQ